MATSTERELTAVDQLDVVVDADAHTSEGIDDLVPYIEDRYGGVKEILAKTANGRSEIYSMAGATPNRFPEGQYGFGEDESGEYTLDQKLQENEDFDIDYALILTNMLGINTVNDDRIAVALASAYNRWVTDRFLDHDQLKGGIIVAPQRPDLAAEEIDRWADHPEMVAVGIPDSGMTYLAGHDFYDPIYEAAQDHGLPVVYHPANSAMGVDFPNLYRRCRTWIQQHVMGHAFSNMATFTSVMFEGIPERFPDLEFVFQEAGLGWVPFLKLRLDDHYLDRGEQVPYLDRLPSEYIRDRFYFTTQPLGHTEENPEHIAWLIDIVGAESVMYSADLPHVDFDPPDELFDRINAYFGPDEVRAVMGGNAVDVFGL